MKVEIRDSPARRHTHAHMHTVKVVYLNALKFRSLASAAATKTKIARTGTYLENSPSTDILLKLGGGPMNVENDVR